MNQITRKFKLDYKTTFLLGLCLGFIGFFIVYGFKVINVTYDGWLLNSAETEGLWDLSQHYQGWRAFRNTPWQFPFGLIEGIADNKVSVAYTDSIPLFAIFFKILSPFLPSTFQYFGIFGFLCYGLIGGFGALISSNKNQNPLFISISSLFFIFNPVLLKRMFYHTALSAHFLILAAICLWIFQDRISRKWFYICSGLLGFFSISINPYFLPMTIGILTFSCFYQFFLSKKITCFLPIIISCLVTLLTGWSIGLLYGDVSASAEGLTRLSFNLNQFVNSGNPLLNISNYQYLWHTQTYSLFLPPLKLTSPWQTEGFAYLGIGVIILCIFSIILLAPQKIPILPKNTLIALICFCTFLILALSPKITFASTVLIQWKPLSLIKKILSVFRSTGRLIWPAYYGIYTACIMIVGQYLESKSNKRIGIILFSLCLGIQLLDLSPAFSYKHKAYTKEITYESPLSDSLWDTIGKNATNIIFDKGSHLGIYCDPGFSCIFEEYAYRYDLDMNLSYLSRDIADISDKETKKHFQSRASGKSYPTTIYVFYSFSKLPDAQKYHLTYFSLNNYTIGVDNENPIFKNK